MAHETRPCEWCGKPMEAAHPRRKYHPECAQQVRKARNKSEQYRAMERVYRQSKKYKTWRRAYNRSEKTKIAALAYSRSEKGKATKRTYEQSEKGKAAKRTYEQSEKGRATQQAYWQSDKYKARKRAYNQSEDGKLYTSIRNQRNRLKRGQRITGLPRHRLRGEDHPNWRGGRDCYCNCPDCGIYLGWRCPARIGSNGTFCYEHKFWWRKRKEKNHVEKRKTG